MILKNTTLLALPLLTTTVLVAQEQVRGRIIDEETGEALIGATVVSAKGKSAITNQEGHFSLALAKGDIIEVSYVGYEPQRIIVDNTRNRLIIRLKSTGNLKEVVVTASAASSRSRKAIGSDVARLDVSKLIAEGGGSNLSDLLDGRVSGMQLYQSNGKVGMPIRFNMRSGATLSLERDPIIYIDGVRYNNSHTSDINTAQDAMSSLNDLLMEDIASIDIIKGSAAAASYGAEAANGVVVITTKRQSHGTGDNKALNASVKVTQGFSTLARKYSQFVNNDAINGFFETGKQTSVYANLSKAFNASNKLYFSANVNHATGIVPGNSDKRQTLKAAYDLRQGKLGLNLSATYVHGAMSIPQTAQGRMDAIWNLMRTQKPWQYVSEETWRAQSWTYDNDRVIASAKVSYTFPFEIKAESQMGLDVNHISGVYYLPYGYMLGTNDQGAKNISQRRNFNFNWDAKLTRQFDLGKDWKLSTTLLSQIVRRYETLYSMNSSLFTMAVNNISVASRQSILETDFEQRTWGLYGEAFLSYQNKLFINAGLRRDASNLIGANVASIYYPTLSVSYNVGDFKFRTAYGESGRLPYPQDARTVYSIGGTSAYGPLVAPGTAGNPNIGPERMRELELGLDYHGAKHSLSLTGYMQSTSDAIMYSPLLSSEGWVGSLPYNIGQIRGWGAELSWNFKAWQSQGKTAGLDLFATVSYQTNKVTNTGGKNYDSFPNVIREGLPAYAFYYYPVLGATYDKTGKYTGAEEGKEYQLLGKPFPDFNGAFGFDLRLFKHLSIGAKFSYALGGSVYNQSFYNVAGLGDNFKQREDLKVALAAETIGTDAYKQIADRLARTEQKRANYVEKSDFLRFSSLSLSYNLSNVLSRYSRGFIKGGRIQLSAQNIALWTGYRGAEPQIEANGGTRQSRSVGSLSRDITNTPSPRTITCSLSIDF